MRERERERETDRVRNMGHLRKAHRAKHLRAEHARVADFHVLIQSLVPVEDLHGGLRVWVVRGLEADVCQACGKKKMNGKKK